jgi:Family of unknown function (DUF6314)
MVVREAWGRIRKVQELSFEARSLSIPNTGWNGRGEGTVVVEAVEPLTTIFHEKGSWMPEIGRPVPFNNVFRWTLDPEGRFIRLEHLRFGVEQPVYLFDLVPAGERTLVSSDPHVCREDLYAARLGFDPQTIGLSWTITGPKKDERINYLYR